MGWGGVKAVRHKTPKNPGFGGWDSFETFTEAEKKEYEKWYKANHPAEGPDTFDSEVEFKAPKGYSANYDHHVSFYKGIRENTPIKEDALFGMQAAGPALASNKSYFEKRIINWNPSLAKEVV